MSVLEQNFTQKRQIDKNTGQIAFEIDNNEK